MGANNWTRSGGDDAAVAGIKFWQGDWATSTLYVKGDGVYQPDNGSSYVCIDQHTSGALSEPGVGADTANYWELIARGGEDGEQGEPGGQGPAGAEVTITYSSTEPSNPEDGDLWIDTSERLDLPVTSADIKSIVTLTQAEYDALTPVATTLYVITD